MSGFILLPAIIVSIVDLILLKAQQWFECVRCSSWTKIKTSRPFFDRNNNIEILWRIVKKTGSRNQHANEPGLIFLIVYSLEAA